MKKDASRAARNDYVQQKSCRPWFVSIRYVCIQELCGNCFSEWFRDSKRFSSFESHVDFLNDVFIFVVASLRG